MDKKKTKSLIAGLGKQSGNPSNEYWRTQVMLRLICVIKRK